MTSDVVDGAQPSFADELPNGTELMLGQFKIYDYLNHGGFGITYLATDSLQRRVVVKECFPGNLCRRSRLAVQARSRAHVKDLEGVVRLFIREAQALSKLEHPNIVGVHQVFEDHGTAYMVLDFIEGADLLDYIEQPNKRLSPVEVRAILEKVLDAIGFVHSAGLLHRDISPDNIILTAGLDPKLIDFGAAREQATKATQALSSLRVVKDGYSPQEFYLAGSEQGPASDLYSVGATFYHLITGEAPPDSQVRITAHVAGDPDPYVPLAEKTNAYDDAFCAALDKALSVLPKDRMQSAEDWKAALIVQPDEPRHKPKSRIPSKRLSKAKRLSKLTEPAAKPPRKKKAGNPASVRIPAVAATVAAIGVLVGASYLETEKSGRATLVAATPELQADPPTAITQVASAVDIETDAPAEPQVTPAPISVDSAPPESPVADAPEAPAKAEMQLVWADGRITVTPRLDLPFTIGADGVLRDVDASLLSEGARLSELNGIDYAAIDDPDGQLKAIALAGEDGTTTLALTVTDPDTGATSQVSIGVEILFETAFENGLRTETRAQGDTWLTTVTARPESGRSDIEIGDQLVALAGSNERINGRETLARVAANALETGETSAEFALRRNGTLWIKNIDLGVVAE